MKNVQKTLILAIILLVLPLSGQASSSWFELKNELRTASIALTGLSSDPVIRRSQLSFISQELNRIAAQAGSLSSSQDGRVLGATSSNSSSQRGNIANVEIEPRNSSEKVYAEGNRKTILSFRLEPEFSDISVQMVRVSFDEKIWRYAETISLTAGNKILAKIDDPEDDDFSESDDDIYSVAFSGFSYEIPEGRSRDFKIKIEARENVSVDEIRVFLGDNAVRIKDQNGFAQQMPSRSGGERGIFSNRFEVIKR